MHALTLRAIRCEMGISEERASRRAAVDRKTLRRYEDGGWIATRTKRQRLDVMYGGWRAELAWEVEVARTASDDDELSPRDAAGEPPVVELLPVPVDRAA